jgi:hypothetical protein
MLVLGSIFLSLGGTGLTGIGAAGSVFAARHQLDNVGGIVMGLSGVVAGAVAAVGSIVLTFGARREVRFRQLDR